MENKKTLQYIAAACFAVAALSVLLGTKVFNYIAILNLGGCILLAVGLFLAIPLLSASGGGLLLLSNSILTIRAIINDYPTILFVCYLLFAISSLFLIIACINRKSAVLFGIFSAVFLIVGDIFWIIISNWATRTGLYFYLKFVSTAVGSILLGMVFTDSAKQPAAVAVSAAVTPKPNYSDAIEKLTKLKSLLDAGVITQEEFDAKKASIL